MKTLTIIIPTWNRAIFLNENLKILFSYIERGLIFKILVCNNGSTDNTIDVLKKWEGHPQLNIINHLENIKYDRNVASGYLNFDTDFCFCLGDTKTLSFESLEKIIKTINEEDIDALVINTKLHIEFPLKYYSEINNLMSDLGVFLTNISSCVIPKSFITKERCERFYDSQFIHYGVFIDALCKKEIINVKFDPTIEKQLIRIPDVKHPHGWTSRTCSIWGKTWIAFVMSLPNKILVDTKWVVIQNLNKQSKDVSPKKFIFAKINQDESFFDDYKRNKHFIKLISTTPIIVYDIISMIPSIFYRLLYFLKKKLK